jgi:2-octaprenyl-6-methoxyphenol hydroxylase
LSPAGWSFEPAPDDGPLWAGCTRTGTCGQRCARAPRQGKNLWLLWRSRVESVDRGDNRVVVALEDGRKLAAPILVAADGRNSPMREMAGLRVARWRYDHRAIVSVLRHEKSHEHIAYEIFYPAGPFALLPMTDDAAAIDRR